MLKQLLIYTFKIKLVLGKTYLENPSTCSESIEKKSSSSK